MRKHTLLTEGHALIGLRAFVPGSRDRERPIRDAEEMISAIGRDLGSTTQQDLRGQGWVEKCHTTNLPTGG